MYVALPSGAYRYDAVAHELRLVAASDLRRVTGYQDFVDEAPMDLVYVADHARMRMVPVGQRESYASVAAGAIAQNVYLFAAGSGLATVIRAWIDRAAIADVPRAQRRFARRSLSRIPRLILEPGVQAHTVNERPLPARGNVVHFVAGGAENLIGQRQFGAPVSVL